MDSITVGIRVRPLNQRELVKEQGTSVWTCDDHQIIYQPTAKDANPQAFKFDHVFDQEYGTVDIYSKLARGIIKSYVEGFNGTIFAYGQTSSGKTYTMQGTKQKLGIIPMAIHDVFEFIGQAREREFLLRVSYMEIYNERITDLLNPDSKKSLKVHENIERGIFVGDLSEKIVTCPEEVLGHMARGDSNRSVGATKMNAQSSRSHSIFSMVIESRERPKEGSESPGAVKVSSLNLVDLAGSERISQTGAEGVRLKEAGNINKSLLTLGTVINKLSQGDRGHIPYRDSKLTRILQSALGGNSRTAIVCNITPAVQHVDETLSTLQFATRANNVVNAAQVNEVVDDKTMLKRYKKQIAHLQKQIQAKGLDTILSEKEQIEKAKNEVVKELEVKEIERTGLMEEVGRLKNLIINTGSSRAGPVSRRDRKRKEFRRETWAPNVTGPLLAPTPTKERDGFASTFGDSNADESVDLDAIESAQDSDASITSGAVDTVTSEGCDSPASGDSMSENPGSGGSTKSTSSRTASRSSLSFEELNAQAMRTRINDLVSQLESAKELETTLTSENAQVEQERDELQARVDAAEQEALDAKQRADLMADEVEAAAEERRNAAMYQAQVTSLTATNTKLETDLTEATEKLATLSEEVGPLKEMEVAYKELQWKQQMREAEEKEQGEKLAELRRELAKAIDESSTFQLNLSRANAEAAKAKDESATLSEKVAQLESDNAAMKKAGEEAESKIAELTAKISEQESSMSESSAKLAQVEGDAARVPDLVEQLAKAKADLEEAQSEIESVSVEKDRLASIEAENDATISQVRMEHTAIVAELDAARKEIDAFKSSKEGKQQKKTATLHQREVDNLKNKLAAMEDKYKLAVKEKAAMSTDKGVHERENKKLTKQNALLQKENDKLNDVSKTNKELVASMATLQKKFDASTKQWDATKAKESSFEETKSKLSTNLEELQAKLTATESACEEHTADLTSTKEKVTELETTLAEVTAAAETKESELTTQVTELTQTVEENKVTMLQLEEKVAEHEVTIAEKAEVETELRATISEMEASGAAKTSNLDKVEEEKSKVTSQFTELNFQYMDVQEQNNELQATIKEKDDDLTELRTRVADYTAKLDTLTTDHDKLITDHEKTCADLKSAQTDLEDSKTKGEAYAATLDELSTENDTLREKVEELEASKPTVLVERHRFEVGELERKIETISEEKAAVDTEMSQLKAQLAKVVPHIKKLQTAVDKGGVVISTLKSKKKSTDRRIALLEATIQRYQGMTPEKARGDSKDAAWEASLAAKMAEYDNLQSGDAGSDSTASGIPQDLVGYLRLEAEEQAREMQRLVSVMQKDQDQIHKLRREVNRLQSALRSQGGASTVTSTSAGGGASAEEAAIELHEMKKKYRALEHRMEKAGRLDEYKMMKIRVNLEAELQYSNKKRQASQAEIRALKADIERLKDETERYQSELRNREFQLANEAARHRQMAAKVHQLEQRTGHNASVANVTAGHDSIGQDKENIVQKTIAPTPGRQRRTRNNVSAGGDQCKQQ